MKKAPLNTILSVIHKLFMMTSRCIGTSVKQASIFSLVICLSFISSMHAQESTAQSTPQNTLSAAQLLTKAKALKQSDVTKSTELAHQAVNLSTLNNNDLVTAQAHRLLAELSQKSEQKTQADEYFRQAVTFYNKAGNYEELVSWALVYIKETIKRKNNEQAVKAIDLVLPIAHEQVEDALIGSLYMAKGEMFYKKKQFQLAIDEYLQAVKYFTEHDKAIQKKLGDSHTKLAQAYKRIKNKQKTVDCYQKALAAYSMFNNQKLMARTLNTLAESERKLGNYIVALDYSSRGLAIHDQIDDKMGRAKALNGAGIIYRYIELYEKSLEHAYQAHLLYKELNKINDVAITSNQMGLVYTRLKQFELAKSFYLATLALPEKKVKPKNIASATRELAVIYINQQDYEMAKVMAKKAHTIYQTLNNKKMASVTARITANAYREQGDLKTAIVYYRESLAFAREVGNKLYQTKALTPLAAMHIGVDNEQGMLLLAESLAISKEINSTPQTLYAVRELRKTEKSRGNFAQSLAYAEEEIALTKVIQASTEKKEISVVKAKLHSYKIEMDLAALKKKNHLAQLELEKRNNAVEIAEQARKIAELEITKKHYAITILLTIILMCLIAVLYLNRRFAKTRKQNKELGVLAERDPLTSCYNRRVLLDVLNRDFTDISLLDDYCIMMVDIDHFKVINDTHGHNVGDEVLCGVADLLRTEVRKNDLTVRYGGEEFCILVSGASIEQVMELAENLRQKIEAKAFGDIQVTCSFGITSIKFDAQVPSKFIEQADQALYQSKRDGRNRVTLWSE